MVLPYPAVDCEGGGTVWDRVGLLLVFLPLGLFFFLTRVPISFCLPFGLRTPSSVLLVLVLGVWVLCGGVLFRFLLVTLGVVVLLGGGVRDVALSFGTSVSCGALAVVAG